MQFKNIQQQQKIIFGKENCEISSQMVLLPKSFVPLYYGSTTPMLSNVLKKNFWGASYIIEFFDEKKDFVIEENERAKIDFINKTVKSVIDIDLAKVSDRIGNVVFQFPITIMDLNTLLIKPGAEIYFPRSIEHIDNYAIPVETLEKINIFVYAGTYAEDFFNDEGIIYNIR